MPTAADIDALRQKASALLALDRWPAGSGLGADAHALLPQLKEVREFSLLSKLGERVLRLYPNNAGVRTLKVQALIENGETMAAIAAARAAVKRVPRAAPEWAELYGLIGRAWKQIAVASGDVNTAHGRRALRHALAAYAVPYGVDRNHVWHGINLVATAAFARRSSVRIADEFDPQRLALEIIETLQARPAHERDAWHYAMLAEAALACEAIDNVEKYLGHYLAAAQPTAFELAGTLRQFEEVWQLKDTTDARKKGILQCLGMRLLQLPGGQLEISPADVRASFHVEAKDLPLQAILGHHGTETFRWWKTGLERALSVAAICHGVGERRGTGFVVAARDFDARGPDAGDPDQRWLVTNYHVVNRIGADNALRPDDATAVFDAIDPERVYELGDVVWESPTLEHDVCVLQLRELPTEVRPLPLARALPVIEATAKVYIIGHPGGGGLEFSFQDNLLLDHEGPVAGRPPNPCVCRLHYRTPTKHGSSGSPVFNAKYWQVIALHHAGGEMPLLNGKEGKHAANEGIALHSIVKSMKADPRVQAMIKQKP